MQRDVRHLDASELVLQDFVLSRTRRAVIDDEVQDIVAARVSLFDVWSPVRHKAIFPVISNTAIAHPIATSIEEFAPAMGMCSVQSEMSSSSCGTPVFSAPRIRQLFSSGAGWNRRMSTLADVISRLAMVYPCARRPRT